MLDQGATCLKTDIKFIQFRAITILSFLSNLCSAFGLRNKSLGTTFKEQSEYLGSHNPLKMILIVGCKLQTHQIIVKMTLVD